MNVHAPSGGVIAVFAAQVVSASPAGSLPWACTHAPAVSSGRARLSSPRRSTCPAGLSRRGSAVLRHDSAPNHPKTRLKRSHLGGLAGKTRSLILSCATSCAR